LTGRRQARQALAIRLRKAIGSFSQIERGRGLLDVRHIPTATEFCVAEKFRVPILLQKSAVTDQALMSLVASRGIAALMLASFRNSKPYRGRFVS
jgi:hypothetical protein